ncbi:hypothetical protein C8Q80DRAFT_1173222 [Daedaleopsis nitida]|nr:hypothetical protein C8Q80DRAFT_1173222 [Daedaleopsis nitida]
MPPPDPHDVWSNMTAVNFLELSRRVRVDTERSTPRRTVMIIMKIVGVPKLTKRSGLKRACRLFEGIAMKLNWLFDHALGEKWTHITRAIVSIWLSMCPDQALCRKLMEAAGILQRLLQVVARDADGRSCALQLLSVLALYSLDRCETGLLELIKPLVTLLHNQDDLDVIEDTVVTLAHVFDRQSHVDAPVSVGTVSDILMRPLAQTADTVMELLRRPFPPHRLVVHALPILNHRFRASSLVDITRPHHAPLLNLVASMLRSENITLRSFCVLNFFDLFNPRDELSPITFPATQWTNRSRRLSPDSLRIIEDYGATRCESEQYARSADAFVTAFNRLLRASHRDVCDFGRRLVSIILDGRYHDIIAKENLPNRNMFRSFGLQYTSWIHYLLLAASALHAQGEVDAADTLQIEYLRLTASTEKIVASCKIVVSRNPRHVYAHIQLSLHTEKYEEFARFSKKTMELPGLSPSLRRSILRRCIELTAGNAIGLLRAVSPSDRPSLRFAAELFQRARRTADVFLSESPPDCPENIVVLRLKIMASFVLYGQQLGDDFSELQPSLQAMRCTARLLKDLGYKIQEDTITAEFDMMMHHSREGLKSWGGLITELNRRETGRRTDVLATDLDVLAEQWLEDYIEHGKMPAHCETNRLHFVHTGPVYCGCDGNYLISLLETPSPGLYRCSRCGKRSALVRKCGRCQNAWYCNTKCQTDHWEAHKRQCRSH